MVIKWVPGHLHPFTQQLPERLRGKISRNSEPPVTSTVFNDFLWGGLRRRSYHVLSDCWTTFQGTITYPKVLFKMIFLFPRWDMLVLGGFRGNVGQKDAEHEGFPFPWKKVGSCNRMKCSCGTSEIVLHHPQSYRRKYGLYHILIIAGTINMEPENHLLWKGT